MDLNATREEKLKVVYDCLVDGLPFFPSYGLVLDYKPGAYEEAKKQLNDPDVKPSWREPGEVCREDIWTEIVSQGDELVFRDIEDPESAAGILSLAGIDAHWPKLWELIPRHMADLVSENYDANTTDCIIQVLIFGEVVYG